MTLNDGILGTNSQLESSDITPIALQDSGQTSSQSNNSGDLSYNVKYDDLASGVQNIESAVKDVNNNISECNHIIQDIFNESTFMGPFADYCYGTWNNLSELTVQTNSALDNSAKVLDNNNAAYNESDKNTGEKVGSV